MAHLAMLEQLEEQLLSVESERDVTVSTQRSHTIMDLEMEQSWGQPGVFAPETQYRTYRTSRRLCKCVRTTCAQCCIPFVVTAESSTYMLSIIFMIPQLLAVASLHLMSNVFVNASFETQRGGNCTWRHCQNESAHVPFNEFSMSVAGTLNAQLLWQVGNVPLCFMFLVHVLIVPLLDNKRWTLNKDDGTVVPTESNWLCWSARYLAASSPLELVHTAIYIVTYAYGTCNIGRSQTPALQNRMEMQTLTTIGFSVSAMWGFVLRVRLEIAKQQGGASARHKFASRTLAMNLRGIFFACLLSLWYFCFTSSNGGWYPAPRSAEAPCTLRLDACTVSNQELNTSMQYPYGIGCKCTYYYGLLAEFDTQFSATCAGTVHVFLSCVLWTMARGTHIIEDSLTLSKLDTLGWNHVLAACMWCLQSTYVITLLIFGVLVGNVSSYDYWFKPFADRYTTIHHLSINPVTISFIFPWWHNVGYIVMWVVSISALLKDALLRLLRNPATSNYIEDDKIQIHMRVSEDACQLHAEMYDKESLSQSPRGRTRGNMIDVFVEIIGVELSENCEVLNVTKGSIADNVHLPCAGILMSINEHAFVKKEDASKRLLEVICNAANERSVATFMLTLLPAPQHNSKASDGNSSADYYAKFDATDGGFEGTFGTKNDYLGGLDELIGPLRAGGDNERHIHEEHCCVEDPDGAFCSKAHFTTDNYHIRTTPYDEYWHVANPDRAPTLPKCCPKDVIQSEAKGKPVFMSAENAIADPRNCREKVNISYFMENMYTLVCTTFEEIGWEIPSDLRQRVMELTISKAEFIALRLYTGETIDRPICFLREV